MGGQGKLKTRRTDPSFAHHHFCCALLMGQDQPACPLQRFKQVVQQGRCLFRPLCPLDGPSTITNLRQHLRKHGNTDRWRGKGHLLQFKRKTVPTGRFFSLNSGNGARLPKQPFFALEFVGFQTLFSSCMFCTGRSSQSCFLGLQFAVQKTLTHEWVRSNLSMRQYMTYTGRDAQECAVKICPSGLSRGLFVGFLLHSKSA